jgi:hypothetical protein
VTRLGLQATAVWSVFTPFFLANPSTLRRNKYSPDVEGCSVITNRRTIALDPFLPL